MNRALKIDAQLLYTALLLSFCGIMIFLSASLGFLTRGISEFTSVALKQVFLAFIPGIILMFVFAKVPYEYLRKYALYIFGTAIILNVLIFVPHLGVLRGGATRWLNLGPLSFQPSEVLKIGAIIYCAAWFSAVKDKVKTWTYGFFPILAIIGVCGLLCLLQRDTDTFAVIAGSIAMIYFVAGAKWSHMVTVFCIGLVVFAGVVAYRPYVMERIKTYLDPSQNALSQSYQIQQSLIAVGSGEIIGRGFGQSIQKFNFLPVADGDSIFAVAAEEFGFLGSVFLVGLFMFFVIRIFKLARAIDKPFGSYLLVGIGGYIFIQAFVNIGAMVGLLPLSGIPLPFVSQGGTALLLLFVEVGILFNISKYAKLK
ncbi:MAG TPA: putative peptidoglycan glycosyltransferase FtsW [Candidatus Paceibacterota bacterium]|nr:putative peptidoglycan glycosyltransferase FtsW [Candidatus Paceibacterota bacterium]